jgi:radical SAM protein with 4Fe4S-binding SPASM domain
MFVGTRDTLELLKPYMRPRRLWNAVKVYASYYWGRLTGSAVQWGKPIAMGIEPTTACNLGCPQCPSGLNTFTRPTGKMTSNQFSLMIEKVADACGYVTLYFQGEPYINKDFTSIVAECTRRGLYTATSTNAHFLTEAVAEQTIKAGLKRLIISIDGVTQESYSHYRIGGNLEKVLEGTRNILNVRKRLGKSNPAVIWQFIVFAHNEHELKAMKSLAKEYGVDKLAVKTAQIYDTGNAEQWLPQDYAKARYRKNETGGLDLKFSGLKHCSRLWSNPVVTWDGELVPCCFDKDAEHRFGNLLNDDWNEIWQGEKAKAFRRTLKAGRHNIDICRNCSEGTRVWL